MHYHVVFKGNLKHLFKNRDFSDGFLVHHWCMMAG